MPPRLVGGLNQPRSISVEPLWLVPWSHPFPSFSARPATPPLLLRPARRARARATRRALLGPPARQPAASAGWSPAVFFAALLLSAVACGRPRGTGRLKTNPSAG